MGAEDAGAGGVLELDVSNQSSATPSVDIRVSIDDRQVIMVPYFGPRKSPPGFSNHSNGKAVDFMTRQGRVTYTANTSQRSGWRMTWLHEWLVQNAEKYGFHPLDSEEWHWDFR